MINSAPSVGSGGRRPEDAVVLAARDIAKAFPGVRALDGACLELRQGEVHALVGENGAGKSTLMGILAGALRPDAGEVRLDGRAVEFASPRAAARAGVGVVFQELSLAPNLSIAENVFAGRPPTRCGGFVDGARARAETRRLLGLFELDLDPAAAVGELSLARQQVVEILKALAPTPRVLILDEPTSALTATEVALLFRTIRQRRDRGTAFVYISHHLPELFSIADRVTVMRDGCTVGTSAMAAVTEADLVRRMVGRELPDVFGRRTSAVGSARLEVRNVSRAGSFEGVSFTLRAGEILGLAGLVGAGRTELGRALFGAEPVEAGEIRLDGRPLVSRSPREAIRNGIAYQTEDRKAQGLFLRLSLRENCVAPSLAEYAGALGLLDDRRIRATAEACRQQFGIAARGTSQPVLSLSGGNQQKVLLAMWVGVRPRVLIVDEPTRGVDVGARSEIYGLLRRLAATGVAILMISSDLQEILGLSDRVLVMRQGRVVAELDGATASEEHILAAAAGVPLR